jgi:A/G-specific adenine glycosylase
MSGRVKRQREAVLLPSAATLKAIRGALLRHYAAHARDLPWRRTQDPYAIWVSEIMLQQTRVETVLRYYQAFLKRFPSVDALAGADEDAVLAAWSGLGYYRRARLLHAGVREVVARYGGTVPEDSEARRSLPGVGRYTAGAIGSIAFDRAEALVDGNVARVFARLFGVDTPLGRTDTQARLWSLAEALVPGPQPGALNQAVMELGATLCSKAAPSCGECPLAKHCQARSQGRVNTLPVVSKKRPPRVVALVAVVALDASRERLLLVRSQERLFGGLWNLPMAEGADLGAAARALDALRVQATLQPRPLAQLEHVLTHRRMQLQVFAAELDAFASSPDVRLQAHTALAELGISSLTRKALAAVFRAEPGVPAGDGVAAIPRTY